VPFRPGTVPEDGPLGRAEQPASWSEAICHLLESPGDSSRNGYGSSLAGFRRTEDQTAANF
jgi:hypothetical protein